MAFGQGGFANNSGSGGASLVYGSPVAVGTANADGADTDVARADHVHDLTEATLRTVAGELTASLDVNAQKIVDLATPTNASDAATKGYVDGVASGSTTVDTFANRPSAAGPTGSRFICTDDDSEWVLYGGVWRPRVANNFGHEPPEPTSWTWRNQGSSSMAKEFGRVNGSFSNSGAAINVKSKTTPMPAPSTATIRGLFVACGGNGRDNYHGQAVVMRESATGRMVSASLFTTTQSGTNLPITSVNAIQWSADGVTFVGSNDFTIPWNGPAWLGLDVSGSNVLYRVSYDGTKWFTFRTEALTTAFTTAPDEYGWGSVVLGSTMFAPSLLAEIQCLSLRLT